MSKDAVGFDMGCGTGRWAQFVASKVKTLNCVEPSDAIYAAKKNINDSVRFANLASGVVVGKIGSATTTMNEIITNERKTSIYS